MARNWIFLTVLGFAIGGSLLFFIYWACHRFCLAHSRSNVPRWKTAMIRSRLPFWRRASAQKEYELVSRHEV